MKAIYRKLIFTAAAVLSAGILPSCIGDLDTVPRNPYDKVPETAYGADEADYLQGLSKLYFQFISNDTQDLQVSDGGASELVRAFWSVQETTTDEAKCAWNNDAWVRALNTNTWTEAQNDATYAVYVRTLQGISYANEFLRQTTDDKLNERGVGDEVRAKVAQFRAEARFIRAYFYWMAIDTFGNVPFITEESDFGSGVNPRQGFSCRDVSQVDRSGKGLGQCAFEDKFVRGLAGCENDSCQEVSDSFHGHACLSVWSASKKLFVTYTSCKHHFFVSSLVEAGTELRVDVDGKESAPGCNPFRSRPPFRGGSLFLKSLVFV